MLNFEKNSKWILIPLALFILSLTGLVILYGWLLFSGKAEINLIPILTTIGAAIIAPWVGVKTFLNQQRIARVQKIYYEESLLDLQKHLDEAFNITNQNIARFENAINLIKLNQSSSVVTLNEIANEIKAPLLYQSSKREVLISLFGKHGYVMHQWLFKFDKDFNGFNLFLHEVVFSLFIRLQAGNKISDDVMNHLQVEVKNKYNLVLRHSTLLYLFNSIISIIGTLDFKSRKKLIKGIQSNGELNDQLKKMNEAFKILFAYYKLKEKVVLSYLISDSDFRFKLTLIDDNMSPERLKYNDDLSSKEFKIIMNDLLLSNLTVFVDNAPVSYSKIQLGMANKVAFDEKPLFYPEAEMFNNF